MNRREFISEAVACTVVGLWIGVSLAGAVKTGDCPNGWQCECITNNWINADFTCGGWDESTGLKVLVDGTEVYCVTETISGKHRVHAFDMRKFRGGKVRLAVSSGGAFERAQLGQVTVTDQPAAKAWVHSVPIAECVPVSVTRKRTPDAKFIRVPIYRDAMPVTCVISDGGRAVYDVRVRLATDGKGDLVASYPIDGFTSDRVKLTTRQPVLPRTLVQGFEQSVSLSDRPSVDPNLMRPKLHFTAPFGGSGDIVGCFRLNGKYHLGYLHEYGYDIWGENCSWSHAVSDDFFDWRNAAAYDRKGVEFRRTSGCCFVDARNASGLGDGKTPPVLLYGCIEHALGQRGQLVPWGPASRPKVGGRADDLPKLFLKVSRDGGRTFQAFERPLITMKALGGHDPEVAFDAASGNYVMVVHDRHNGTWGFDFYVSKNLLDWEYTSSVPGMWETPNFYPLACEGRQYWVLQQCELQYKIGTFDGRVFHPIVSRTERAYVGAFAPRTWLTDDGRRVLMAASSCMGPHGGATLPMEVRIVRTKEGLRLAYTPVREIAKYASCVRDETVTVEGDTYDVCGRKGRFLEGEPHTVRTIVDGPVIDYFVGWGIVAGMAKVPKADLGSRLDALKERFFDSRTEMLYDVMWECPNGASAVAALPTAEEVARQWPNPCAWGVGMQDCVFNGAPFLLTAMAVGDWKTVRAAYRGLRLCAKVSGVPGFVVRGVLPTDGKSFYINSSRDVYTLFVYALWRLYKHPGTDAEWRREIRELLVDVASFAEKCVVPANDYELLRADGRRGIVGKMWMSDPRAGGLQAHEALRLSMLYAAAYAVSGDRHWREMELKYADDGIRIAGRPLMANIRGSILGQMQLSQRLLWKCETDSERKARYAELLRRCADEAEKGVVPRMVRKASKDGWLLHKPLKNWRQCQVAPGSMTVGGYVYGVPDHPAPVIEEPFVELSHAILVQSLAVGRPVSAKSLQIFKSVLEDVDFRQIICANAVNALLAAACLQVF